MEQALRFSAHKISEPELIYIGLYAPRKVPCLGWYNLNNSLRRPIRFDDIYIYISARIQGHVERDTI